jgi:Rrf2 family protein
LARDIAVAEDIPRSFLSKILHQLGQKGLVRSQKGPGGGFELARPASELTLEEVSLAVDGVHQVAQRCLLGRPECNDADACALHHAWKNWRSEYARTIGALTLAAVAQAPGASPPGPDDPVSR